MKDIIVVTGGAGFVGANLIQKLLKNTKFKIFSLDNYSTGNKKNHIINSRVKYYRGSTKDIDKIFKKSENYSGFSKSKKSDNINWEDLFSLF